MFFLAPHALPRLNPNAVASIAVALVLTACESGGRTAQADAQPPQVDATGAVPTDAAPSDAHIAVPDADSPLDAAPDAAPPPPPGRLTLNEIDCRDRAAVELVNAGGSPLSLDGWVLADPIARAARRVALSGVIEPGARIVVEPPFALACGESVVRLLDPTGEERERVPVPVQAAAWTWGRLPDATGDWAPNAPSLGEPNRRADPPMADFFDPDVLHDVALTIEAGADVAFLYDRRLAVQGTASLDGGAAVPVAITLTGHDGRYRRLDQKPSFRVNATSAGGLGGLSGFDLDGAVLDPAFLTRLMSSELLQTARIPSQRVGLARLTLEGEDLGVYLLVEPLDEAFASRFFVSTWHIYRGSGFDLFPEHIDRFDILVGAANDRRDLRAVVGAVAAELPEGVAFDEATADWIDWPALWRALAAEAWLGSLDGYGLRRRDVVWHLDERARLSLLPDGLDTALRTPVHFHAGLGRLMSSCQAQPACRARYDAALAEVGTDLAGVDWAGRLAARAARVRPLVEADPRMLWPMEMFDREVARIHDFLLARPGEVEALLTCLATEQDRDGDGFICDLDCAPDNPTIYHGAPEICGDGVDQSCSGEADDASHCPGCTAATWGTNQYLFCPARRTRNQARTLCNQLGADLAIIEGAGENTWVFRRAQAIVSQDWWIGLDDLEEEGRFVWVDGREPAFVAWAPGEPNDYGAGEDCVHFRGDGLWNDIGCEARLGVICELPCDPTVDADGDGFPGCGLDCDDGDPAIHPEAVDLCGDGIDQSCSGRPDDGEGCTCVPYFFDGHRYLVCPGAVPYAEMAAVCAAEGAVPLRIDDAALNLWIWQVANQLAPQRYWMGLDDLAVEGQYRWADGASPAFLAFSRGEPNDGGRQEDCVHFWEDRPEWNDIGCGARHGVLCADPVEER